MQINLRTRFLLKNGGTNIVRTGVTLLLPHLIEKGIYFFHRHLKKLCWTDINFFYIISYEVNDFYRFQVKGQGQLSSVKEINCLHNILRTPYLTDIKLCKSNLLLETTIYFEFTINHIHWVSNIFIMLQKIYVNGQHPLSDKLLSFKLSVSFGLVYLMN